ncbi:MAG TPA: protease modulator HflC, partial [Prosthecobacter sp.]
MKSSLLLIAALGLFIVLSSACYTVDQTEQVIITQFGMPVGQPVTDAGLHWKVPFIQTVNRIEKRVLEWDGPSTQMTTKNKVFVMVDTFARWQIVDPLMFFRQLTDERRALSRLNGIIGSETRIVIARHDFTEAVRTTKDRKVVREAVPTTTPGAVVSTAEARIGVLPSITRGRTELEKEIFANAANKVDELGIKLLDVRLKRIDYDPSVSQSIYQRMITERQQIADRYRAEGAGEA